MNWQKWVVLAYFTTSGLYGVWCVGKPRTPYTPSDVIFALIVLGFLGALVVTA